jgi:hypothetical protein
MADVIARIPRGDAPPLEVVGEHLDRLVLRPEQDGPGWELALIHPDRTTRLHGPEAIRAAGLILPMLNQAGGTRREVGAAVGLLERAGSSEEVFATAARTIRRHTSMGTFQSALHEGPPEVLLALEMAAHEETEREAMEGELRFLELAWKEAEAIAAIADSLALPEAVERRLGHREQGE